MLPLPMPVNGGRVDELRRFVNVPGEDGWILYSACLIAYLRPRGPYPVLVLNGEHGSAKSTTARCGRAVIDPNQAPLRRPPNGDRDLMMVETSRGGTQSVSTAKYEITGRGGKGREILKRGTLTGIVPEEPGVPVMLDE